MKVMYYVIAFLNGVFVTTLFVACTVNLIQTDTHGTAQDVVDSNPSTSADVKPNLTVPVSPL